MNVEGIDLEWVNQQLATYVDDTRAVNQSSDFVFTSQTKPACGRDRAIELSEVVRSILNRLYPEWRSENTSSKNDEFKAERDAASRLISRLKNHVELESRLGPDLSPRISTAEMHPLIWKAAQAQWSTGHRHEAVLAAAKAVNSHLQSKIGRRDVSESDLVRQAFSQKAPEPGRSRLRFDHIDDEQTRASMRQGVMDFGAGCFAAIRNPLGHLPNEEYELSEQSALEQLASLSLLTRWIDQATLEDAPIPDQ
jgi:uncharacterized protein (TIGR02391 family)